MGGEDEIWDREYSGANKSGEARGEAIGEGNWVERVEKEERREKRSEVSGEWIGEGRYTGETGEAVKCSGRIRATRAGRTT
jgi:hypothetical protein